MEECLYLSGFILHIHYQLLKQVINIAPTLKHGTIIFFLIYLECLTYIT